MSQQSPTPSEDGYRPEVIVFPVKAKEAVGTGFRTKSPTLHHGVLLAGRLACSQITDAELCEIKAVHYQMQANFIRRDLPGYFRLNQAIHKWIVDAARNPVLAAMHENLNSRLLRVRYLASRMDQERWVAAMREHELIIDALVRRSADETADLLLQHLRDKYESICQHLDRLWRPDETACFAR